jgi:hypothetical protein
LVAILTPRRLRELLDVTQPGVGLPDQGVPVLHSSNSSFVIQTIAGGAGGSFSLGASNLGNTLGQTGVTGSRVVLAGIGNLTLSQMTDANGGTISISAGTAGAGFSAGVSGGNTAGDTGATGTRLVLAGGNNITLSQATDANGGTVTVVGPSTVAQTVQTQNLFDLTLSGNTAGVLQLVSSGTLTLAGGNNVTLSQNGNAITISGAAQSVQPETQTFLGGISASDTMYTSGTVRFTGVGGGVTVSSNTGQRVDISVAAPVAQTVQTQNLIAMTLSGNTSGAQALISSGTMTLAGGNNITVSQNGNAVTISGPNVGGAQTGISGLANSQTTYTSGTVSLSELGAITIRSTTGNQFQFSVNAQSVQTQSLMSVGVSTGGNTAGDTGVTGTRMVFVGSNNITLSQATAAAGGTITISGPTTVAQTNQSGGAYAVGNTYSSSSGTFDARTLSIRGDGIISVAATNSGWRISASQSVQAETQTFVGGLAASNTTYTSGTITITGVGGGVTVSSNTGQRIDISVASPVAQTGTQFSMGLSNIGNTVGDTGTVAGRVVLAGGNNITLSGSTNGASETITISAFAQTVESQSIGASNLGNTLGTSGVASGGQVRMVIIGTSNITVSQSVNGASGTMSLIGQPSFSAGVSNIGNSSGDTGVTGTRLVFAGGNNITLSQSTNANGGTVTISAPNLGAGAMSAGASNLGNTAGATGITGTQLVLVGSGVMSLSQTTGANGGTVSILAPATSVLSAVAPLSTSTNGSTISILGPAQLSVGFSTNGNTAGDTGFVTARLALVGSNNITLSGSTNAGSQTISIIGGGGGGFSAGASNLGNTAGATGISGTQMVLVGSGVMSLSQTTGANGNTVSILAPATSSLVGTSGVSISTNGSTISVMATSGGLFVAEHNPYGSAPQTTGAQGQGILHIQPMQLQADLRMDRVLLGQWISNATNSSNSITLTQLVGIYTKTASTLSLLVSSSITTNFTGSGTVGSYSLYGGRRWLSIPLTTTLSQGDYYLAIAHRSTTGGGAGHTVAQILLTQMSNATFSGWSGLLGVATNATMQHILGMGTYSASTATPPNSIGFTAINGTGTLAMMPPMYALRSGTV